MGSVQLKTIEIRKKGRIQALSCLHYDLPVVELQLNGMDQSGQSGNTSSQQIIFTKRLHFYKWSKLTLLWGVLVKINEGKP
jgi:hypothetical protein